MQRSALLLAALVAVAGCRDGVAIPEFAPRDSHPDSAAVRLTYNVRDDRVPVWSGDSIYFSTSGQPALSRAHEWIASMHRRGPIARVLLPDQGVASALPKRFGAPALSHDGRSIAIVEVTDTASLTMCSLIMCNGAAVPNRDQIPHIQGARLHVRQLREGPTPTQATLDIVFDGREPFVGPHPSGNFPVIMLRVHPFQQRYSRDRDQIFRPAFSPDGSRIAFSDGLNIHIWTIGGEAAVVPGTEDGVFPAWSPNGEWIAFSRLHRGTPADDLCECYGTPGRPPGEYYDRTVWSGAIQPARLTIMRPDGSGMRELGEGYAPAWTPDSRALVAQRSDTRLWSIPLDGAARVIEGTEAGHEPAFSAGGGLLAFARYVRQGNSDIWVVPFSNR